jgi:hypothetical protein
MISVVGEASIDAATVREALRRVKHQPAEALKGG